MLLFWILWSTEYIWSKIVWSIWSVRDSDFSFLSFSPKCIFRCNPFSLTELPYSEKLNYYCTIVKLFSIRFVFIWCCCCCCWFFFDDSAHQWILHANWWTSPINSTKKWVLFFKLVFNCNYYWILEMNFSDEMLRIQVRSQSLKGNEYV